MKLKIATACACALMLSACGSGSDTGAVQDDPVQEPSNWLVSFDERFQEAFNSGNVWRCTGVLLWSTDSIRSFQSPNWYQFAVSVNPEADEVTFYTSASGDVTTHTRRLFDYQVHISKVDTVWGRWSLHDRIDVWPFDDRSGFLTRYHKDGHFLLQLQEPERTTNYACSEYDYFQTEVTGNLISMSTFGS